MTSYRKPVAAGGGARAARLIVEMDGSAAAAGLRAEASFSCVSAGAAHVIALCKTGEVVAWGDNSKVHADRLEQTFDESHASQGQCGHSNSIDTPNPTPIASLLCLPVVSVCCGYNFSAAVTASGLVYTWGANEFGQLGHGNTQPWCVCCALSTSYPLTVRVSHTATAVRGFHPAKITQVAAGMCEQLLKPMLTSLVRCVFKRSLSLHSTVCKRRCVLNGM